MGPGGRLTPARSLPRLNGDDNEPRLADEGLPPDHRRDPLSAARPSEAPADLHLAGPRPRPALSGAAAIPGFLGKLAGRQAALGARRVGDADQAGRVAPRVDDAAALGRVQPAWNRAAFQGPSWPGLARPSTTSPAPESK